MLQQSTVRRECRAFRKEPELHQFFGSRCLLLQVLMYHIIDTPYRLEDLSDGQVLPTTMGDTITASLAGRSKALVIVMQSLVGLCNTCGVHGCA